jgi:UPF0716 family protein affecting phage T7 exclusion
LFVVVTGVVLVVAGVVLVVTGVVVAVTGVVVVVTDVDDCVWFKSDAFSIRRILARSRLARFSL